jgi:hypothetical protein
MIAGGGMSGMGLTFSPYLITRNISSKPLTFSPSFSFEAGGSVQKVELPAIGLASQQTSVVNLREFQDSGLIPAAIETGDLDLEYRGSPGSVIAELASVDLSGSFVSPVPLTCRGNRDLFMSFWRTDGDWESSLVLRNLASEENQAQITISYPGGVYLLEQQIPAETTVMISVNKLQQTQQPDAASNRIPASATMGGINIWSQNVADGFVINPMLINPKTATCNSCPADGWVESGLPLENGANSSNSLFDAHQVGDTFGLEMALQWSDGHFSTDSTNTTTVSVTPSSTATYDAGSSTVTCVGPGLGGVVAETENLWPADSTCNLQLFSGDNTSLVVIQADVFRDGNKVTGQSQDVVVGQQINLSVQILPSGTSTTKTQWTIPGTTVGGYTIAAQSASATVSPMPDLTATSITYYWVDGGDGRQVTFSFKVGRKSFSATTTFNVKRPTSSFSSTSTGAVTIDSSCGGVLMLRYGCASGQNPVLGVSFSRQVTDPNGFPGDDEFAQVVTSTTRHRWNGGTQLNLSGSNVLDGSFPYPGSSDSPAQQFFPGDTQVSVDDSFTMWVIFKPSLQNSIWVPLKSISWSWSGFGQSDGTMFSKSNSPNQTGADTTTHPTWSGNSNALTFQ